MVKGGRLYQNEDLLSQAEVIKLHEEYANSGLVALMKSVGLAESMKDGDGTYVTTFAGQRLMDFTGGYGVNSLGHCHPAIRDAVFEAWGSPNFMQVQLDDAAAKLANNLAVLAPGNLKRSFFGNSGAEAVEFAIKTARAATKRTVILSEVKGFHGKTCGALSVTGNTHYQDPFRPLLPDCETVPFDNIGALNDRLCQRDVAAFIVEAVQGEGGVRLHTEGFLKEAERLCKQTGTLLVVDEVQTGLGRTGKLFACEHWDLKPDIMCLAKALGGGAFPISATMTTEEVWNKAWGGIEKCLLHTSTFGGGHLACVAAIEATNQIVDNDMPAMAAGKGRYLLGELQKLKEKHPIIKDVRGLGLLVGIEIDAGGFMGRQVYDLVGSMIIAELRHKYGVLVTYTLNNPAVIRVMPPFGVQRNELAMFIDAFDKVLAANPSIAKLLAHTAGTAISSAVGRILGKGK